MNPPAGWNPDPFDPTIDRYWDGQQWTAQTRPKGVDAPTQAFGTPRRSSAHPDRRCRTLAPRKARRGVSGRGSPARQSWGWLPSPRRRARASRKNRRRLL
ncbi:DUF2510 domain-containing protein [Rhodococcus sp. 3Y1]